jgi:hypothetical protein
MTDSNTARRPRRMARELQQLATDYPTTRPHSRLDQLEQLLTRDGGARWSRRPAGSRTRSAERWPEL